MRKSFLGCLLSLVETMLVAIYMQCTDYRICFEPNLSNQLSKLHYNKSILNVLSRHYILCVKKHDR